MGERLSLLIKDRLIDFVESRIPLLLIGTEMLPPRRETGKEQVEDMSPSAAKAVLAVKSLANRGLRRSEGKVRSTALIMHAQANQLSPTASWFEFFKTIPSRIIAPCFGYSQAESEETELDTRPNNP